MSDQDDINTVLAGLRMSQNMHAAERRILNLAKTPEEAQTLASYLASIDWEQVFLKRKAPKEVALAEYREEMQKRFLEGGGTCDDCEDEYPRLYVWPHAAHAVSIWAYLTGSKGWYDAPDPWDATYSWCYRRFCWQCFRKRQTEMQVPGESIMDRCDLCGRLTRRPSLYPIREGPRDGLYLREVLSVRLYCLHCLPEASENQFIRCSVCDKKTVNFHADGVCYDCKENPRLRDISSALSRARTAGKPATLASQEWALACAYFRGSCAYCRTRHAMVLEHFLPITLGGGTTVENCVPACIECNGKKASRHPDTLTELFEASNITQIRDYFEAAKQGKVSLILSKQQNGQSHTRALVLWSDVAP